LRCSTCGGLTWVTGLPWREMIPCSSASTVRINCGRRFSASAVLTSLGRFYRKI
jgi:hypothetical protein